MMMERYREGENVEGALYSCVQVTACLARIRKRYEELGYKKPLPNLAWLRLDIIDKGHAVPIGNDGEEIYYGGKEPLEYRWVDDETFRVKFHGKWKEAYSIDFDFINLERGKTREEEKSMHTLRLQKIIKDYISKQVFPVDTSKPFDDAMQYEAKILAGLIERANFFHYEKKGE
jgi:hypothetical protein